MKRATTPIPDIIVYFDNLPPTVRGLAHYLQNLHYPTDHIQALDVDYAAAMSFLDYVGYTESTKFLVVRGLPGNGRKYDGSWYFADGHRIGPSGVDGYGLYAGQSHDYWQAPRATRYERDQIDLAWSHLAGLLPSWALAFSTPYDDETPRQWRAQS